MQLYWRHVVLCLMYKNSEFLSRLESCQSDPVLIAGCFSQQSHGFSVYSSYCTNYPRWVAYTQRRRRTLHSVQLALSHCLNVHVYASSAQGCHLLLSNWRNLISIGTRSLDFIWTSSRRLAADTCGSFITWKIDIILTDYYLFIIIQQHS